ncbi:hypothetical protein ACQZ6F_24510 [Rhizobium sp. A22-96]
MMNLIFALKYFHAHCSEARSPGKACFAMVQKQTPNAQLAAAIAAQALGCTPVAVRRFKTGTQHYVFDLQFADRPPAVVRIGDPVARAEMAGAIYLSGLLRPQGVPLPSILAVDIDAEFPWLLLERFRGTDLGSVISGLTEETLNDIASRVAHAQVTPQKRFPQGATAMPRARSKRHTTDGRR